MRTLFRRQKLHPPPAADEPGSRTEGSFYKVLPDARVSVHADGVVLLHAGTGVVFTANRIAAGIWQGVAGRQSLEAIAATLSSEYGVPESRVARDAAGLLAELEAAGFLCRGR